MNDMLKTLRQYIPDDHSCQVDSTYYIDRGFINKPDSMMILDLGCGTGQWSDYFYSKKEGIRYIGLDIEKSPEVDQRTKKDIQFVSFDGVNIPFRNGCFDIVFCHQVLEHVKYPLELLKEVRRVMKPGSLFIGATSQFEPYHSYSLWNFTPFGFNELIKDAGMRLIEVRPGIDAITLILRRGLKLNTFFSRWWMKDSPLHQLINFYAKIKIYSPAETNGLKLLFSGQFCFMVTT